MIALLIYTLLVLTCKTEHFPICFYILSSVFLFFFFFGKWSVCDLLAFVYQEKIKNFFKKDLNKLVEPEILNAIQNTEKTMVLYTQNRRHGEGCKLKNITKSG